MPYPHPTHLRQTLQTRPADPPARSELDDILDDFESKCAANTAGYLGASTRPNRHSRQRTDDSNPPSADEEAGIASAARDPSEPVTVFHTRQSVPLTLRELARTMQRVTGCTDEALLVAVVLCCRYSLRTRLPVTRHMMHRLYVAALHVGVKVHDDACFSNKDYAARAGVTPAEMNRLEAHLLVDIGFEAAVLLPPPPRAATALPGASNSATPYLASASARVPACSVPAAASAGVGVASPLGSPLMPLPGPAMLPRWPADAAEDVAPPSSDNALVAMTCSLLRAIPVRCGPHPPNGRPTVGSVSRRRVVSQSDSTVQRCWEWLEASASVSAEAIPPNDTAEPSQNRSLAEDEEGLYIACA